jgi:MFS family permease
LARDRRGRFVTGRKAQLGVAVVFFVHGLLFSSWAAHIPHVKARLGLDNGTLGLALLGVPAGSIGAILLAGYLVPRVGSRPLVQVCLVGYCAAGPFVGVAGSPIQLALALFAWGAFQGALDISMNTQAIAVEKYRERPLMNGMHAWWSIGAFAGAGAGAFSVAVGVSLTTQLAVLGAASVVGAGWLTTGMLPDSSREPEHRERRGRRLSPALLTIAGIAFASFLCEGAAADWSAVYLRDSLASSAAVAGLAYTAFILAMVAVRLLGNRLLARYGAAVLLPVLAAAATVGFGAALAIATPAAALVGFLLLGLGVGSVVPTMFSAAGKLPGVHPGVGVATVSGIAWVGFLSGPPLIGQLAQATSLTAALVVVPVLTGAIALATRRVGRYTSPELDTVR